MKAFIDTPIVPETYKSRIHIRIESQASDPASFIISIAFFYKKRNKTHKQKLHLINQQKAAAVNYKQ